MGLQSVAAAFALRRRGNYSIEQLEPRRLLAANLVISEFMAANQSSLVDEYGNSSDWIEIHNAGDASANLGSYFLTDNSSDPEKWQFPTESLPAGAYLIVFASGDNQAVAGQELHTNFKLSATGGYLGLIGPGDVPQFQYLSYPAQSDDISYGLSNADDPNSPIVFFATSTPGAANIATTSEPTFSQASQTFAGSLTVSLTSSTAGAAIYYTTDDSPPNTSSALYTGSITLTATTLLQAIAVANGLAGSPVAAGSYIAVDSSVANFSNNIGIVVVDTHGATFDPNSNTDILATAAFISADSTGTATTLGTPDYIGSIGIHVRGNVSRTFPKEQFAVTLWDANGNSTNASLMGMPSDSDWVLYAPYAEKSLMQNALAMQWANEMGEYASRTQYVEVFLNTDGSGQIDYSSHYWGVYILMEKIKIAPDRVNITQMNTSDNSDSDDTGGYIWKNDWLDAGDLTFTTDIEDITYTFDDPGTSQVTAAQQAYLTNYVDQFEAALYGPDFTDPTTGYAAYINVDTFIDYYLLNEMMKNVDAFTASEYYYKDANGKISMGPVWDFNESLGDANFSGGADPSGWIEAPADSYFNQLLQDPAFQQAVDQRWAQLRQTVFSTSALMADIDAQVDILSDGNGNYPVGDNPAQTPDNPVVRNYDRWNNLSDYVWPNGYYDVNGSWITDVQMTQTWLTERLDWMDSQLLPGVRLTPGGAQTGPVQVSIESDDDIPADTPLLTTASALISTNAGNGWMLPTFDASAWQAALLDPTFNASPSGNSTLYIRIPFNLSDAASVPGLLLQLPAGTDFVAYLNGVEVASAATPDTGAPANAEQVDITEFNNYLVAGQNILAIQESNQPAPSDGPVVNAQLLSRQWTTPTDNPIYYTTDGSDPEAGDGSIGASATLYQAPFTLSTTETINVRTLVNGVWSDLVSSQYLFAAPNLRITELDYDPSKPAKGSAYNNDDFEFVELQNLGSDAINLDGIAFTDGIDYTFGDVMLAPGQVGVLVNNPDAFASRYNTSDIDILGNYESTGQNFSNSGEHVELVDAMQNVLADFTYSSSWYSSTHGSGGTLEVINPQTDPDLNLASSWRVSPVTDGTPGFVPLLLSGDAYLRADANSQFVDVYDNASGTGTPEQVVLLASLYAISYADSTGAGSLAVDFSAGDPLIHSGTSFDGDNGANNLSIFGTTAADTLSVDASTLTFGSASIAFTNSPNIFFLGDGGGDTLTQTAQPAGAASVTFVSPTAADSLNIQGGIYTIAAPPAGGGAVDEYFGGLSVAGGAEIVLAPSDGVDRMILVVRSLSLAGTLDITNNQLLIPYGGTSPIASIEAYLGSGYNGGAWNGAAGIISSTAAADPNGVSSLGSFDTGSEIMVQMAYVGDANMDGLLNADDFSLLMLGQVTGRVRWQDGNFNYDSATDAADLALADNAAEIIPLIVSNAQTSNVTLRHASFSTVEAPMNLAGGSEDWLKDQADILA